MSEADDFGVHWNRELENLYVSAIAIYGVRRMWAANPTRSLEGMRMIARRLRTYGGADEWRYAARIHRALEAVHKLSKTPPNFPSTTKH